MRSQKLRSVEGKAVWTSPVVRRTSGARGRAIWEIFALRAGLRFARDVEINILEVVVPVVVVMIISGIGMS